MTHLHQTAPINHPQEQLQNPPVKEMQETQLPPDQPRIDNEPTANTHTIVDVNAISDRDIRIKNAMHKMMSALKEEQQLKAALKERDQTIAEVTQKVQKMQQLQDMLFKRYQEGQTPARENNKKAQSPAREMLRRTQPSAQIGRASCRERV